MEDRKREHSVGMLRVKGNEGSLIGIYNFHKFELFANKSFVKYIPILGYTSLLNIS